MKAHRLARVGEVIREVASTTILFELKDPRVRNVTVTRAEVSADLQTAKVYVSVMGTEKEEKLALYGLQHAAGFIQSKVAGRMDTRFTPVITFVLDHGVKKSIEIARILAEEKARANPAGAAEVAADAGIEEDTGDDADGDARADAADGPAGKP
jgi:ribosome-binding factor A